MNHFCSLFLTSIAGFTVFDAQASTEAAQSGAIEEIVITASRSESLLKESGVAISVVTAEALEQSGFAPLSETLRSVPGVAVSSQGGLGKVTSVRIRGEEAYRTLMLVDGIEVSDPSAPQSMGYVQHLGGVLGFDRIEVLRGPQGLHYGADAGGVVHMITKTPEHAEGQLAFQLGAFQTEQLDGYWGAGNQKQHALVTISHLETDGYNATTADTSQDDDGYQNTTLHGKFGAHVSDRVKLSAVLRSSDAENAYDNCFPDSNDCLDQTQQKIGKVQMDVSGARTQHTFAVSRSDVTRDYYTDGVLGYAAEGEIQKAEALGQWQATARAQWIWGVDYKTEALQNNYGSDDVRHQTGLYTEWKQSVAEALFISAGVRFDENNTYGESTTFRISPVYWLHLSEEVAIKYRASVGTGFRAPSLSEVAYNQAYAPADQSALSPEKSEGFDLSVEYHLKKGAWFSLGYFDQAIEDEIYYDLDGFYYAVAGGVSHSKGWELGWRWPLIDGLIWESHYTYNETLTESDSPRARRPKHLANTALSFTSANDRFYLRCYLRGAKDSIETTGEALDDYVLVGVNGEWNVSESLAVFIRVDNAADKNYQEVSGYNTPGRTTSGGLKLTF